MTRTRRTQIIRKKTQRTQIQRTQTIRRNTQRTQIIRKRKLWGSSQRTQAQRTQMVRKKKNRKDRKSATPRLTEGAESTNLRHKYNATPSKKITLNKNDHIISNPNQPHMHKFLLLTKKERIVQLQLEMMRCVICTHGGGWGWGDMMTTK